MIKSRKYQFHYQWCHYPVVESPRDLGVLVSHHLTPCLHISSIVAKTHKRSSAIHCVFTSRNVDLLLRAYTTYARPLVEHDSVIWSPYTIKDITAIEPVQRRFPKRLPGLNNPSYTERLQRIRLLSLELRRLYTDLIYCYKIICGMVDLTTSDVFQWVPCTSIRGHSFKLYQISCSPRLRSTFFSERVVNV